MPASIMRSRMNFMFSSRSWSVLVAFMYWGYFSVTNATMSPGVDGQTNEAGVVNVQYGDQGPTNAVPRSARARQR